MRTLFTSECVSVGHPDHLCDYISDSILTEILTKDPDARVACECMASTDKLMIAGEITTKAKVDYEYIARKAINEVGYRFEGEGFDSETVEIITNIHEQSADIALGTNDDVGGSGDQGMMIGGAVNETGELMPLPISIARNMVNRITDLFRSQDYAWMRPDAKTQVTVAYEDGRPVGVDTVVVSVSHDDSITQEEIKSFITEKVIAEVLSYYGFDYNSLNSVYVNPTGKFEIYGPNGDVGLTGRKIIVDTYGSYFGHGGGAFSGKDPSKTDRSGAYMARYIAKNLVAAGVADKVEIQLAYAIGVSEPVSVYVNTYGTEKYSNEDIVKAVYNCFDMTPQGITETLNLRSGIQYQNTVLYGHFGDNTGSLPWELTDKVGDILRELKSEE